MPPLFLHLYFFAQNSFFAFLNIIKGAVCVNFYKRNIAGKVLIRLCAGRCLKSSPGKRKIRKAKRRNRNYCSREANPLLFQLKT
jgi:hypothetical protein